MTPTGEPNHTVWEKNLAVLQQNDPRHAHSLRDCDRRFRARAYRIFQTKDGGLDVRCPSETGQNRPMYGGKSREIVEKVVSSWNVSPTPGETIILLGFGLGEHISRILRQMHRTSRLIVVEPDPLLFYSALRGLDLTEILKDKRVSLSVGLKPDRAVESIGAQCGWVRLSVLPIRLLLHSPTVDLRPGYVQQFRQVWLDALSREAMYRSSKRESGEEVVRHTVRNLPRVMREPGIKRLFGRFNGIPAVQAGAGPSLNDSIGSLRRVSSKVLVTCVNTAYKVLRSEGIEPDIVFCLDHHERNWRSFEGVAASENTILVADPRIDPRIVSLFEGRTFFISWHTTTETIGDPCPIGAVPLPKHGGNAVYKWFQGLIGERGTVTGTGSVAVAGFQILARMGCQPIILIGQDLAFPGTRTYAEGTVFDDPNLPRDSQVTRFVPATNGGRVGTSESLNLYRTLLEHEVKRFGIPVINSSIGGAMIAGSSVVPLDDVAERLPALSSNSAQILTELHSERGPEVDMDFVRSELNKACEWLGRFAREATETASRCRERMAEPSEEAAHKSEEDLNAVIARNPHAFDLLNDLLQEPHILYEEARCRAEVEEDPLVRCRLRIDSVRQALESFQERSELLRRLLTEVEL